VKQTDGKVFARQYFYMNYLASFMTPRQLKNSNVLTLLGEDFREISLLSKLGVPSYRVFSVERDPDIYRRQQVTNREDGNGAALYHGELSDYIHTHLRHHDVSVFNLDICGSYLRAVDPVLGELLLHVRKNPQTVMATYSSAGRDKPQLMEGLKSLVVLLWLAPEVIDRLVRHLYGQYRSAALSDSERGRDELSKNMLLRHMFWLRSHMEHVMIGAYTLGLTESSVVSKAFSEQESVWRRFVGSCQFPVTYGDVLQWVESQSRPLASEETRMDLDFGDIEFLTYAANNGFYHNCYFATYESSGSTVSLDTWLVESAKSLRRNDLVLIDIEGRYYESTFGRLAVDTDRAVLWGKADVKHELRQLAIPPRDEEPIVKALISEVCGLESSTIDMIRQLAREDRSLTARQISQRLSLQLPVTQVAAHMAIARRK